MATLNQKSAVSGNSVTKDTNLFDMVTLKIKQLFLTADKFVNVLFIPKTLELFRIK